jgi:poly-D-alanine transfer protein DltD
MKRAFKFIITTLVLAVLVLFSGAVFYGTKSMHDLLASNEKLKKAITTLTHEDQIGFAKVMKQELRDGRLYTTVRFVETARDDILHKLL